MAQPAENDINFALETSRLRVVSNFGDGDCGAGKIHTRAREISRSLSLETRAKKCELNTDEFHPKT